MRSRARARTQVLAIGSRARVSFGMQAKDPDRRVQRAVLSVIVVVAVMPFACARMSGPWWSRVEPAEIEAWYAFAPLVGTVLSVVTVAAAILGARWPRPFEVVQIRGALNVAAWYGLLALAATLAEPWRQITVYDTDGADVGLVVHPSIPFHLMLVLLPSVLLWATSGTGRRSVGFELAPLALGVVAIVYLTLSERPEVVWP